MPSAGLCVRFLLYLTLIIYCPENFIIIFIKKSFPSNRIPILVLDNRMFERVNRVLVAIPNIYITLLNAQFYLEGLKAYTRTEYIQTTTQVK
jgi:hypothetical protein